MQQLISVSQELSKRFEEQFHLAHYKLYPFYLEGQDSKIFKINDPENHKNKKNAYFWFKNPMMLALKNHQIKKLS